MLRVPLILHKDVLKVERVWSRTHNPFQLRTLPLYSQWDWFLVNCGEELLVEGATQTALYL